MEDYNVKINSDCNRKKKSVTAFYASSNADQLINPAPASIPIQFQDEFFDEGDDFSTPNFIIPKTGIYDIKSVLTIQMINGSTTQIFIDLKGFFTINGTTIISPFSARIPIPPQSDISQVMTLSAVVKCIKNQSIQVRLSNDSGSIISVKQRSSFSGHRVA